MEKEKQTKIKFHILAIVCIIIFGIAVTPVTLQNDTFYTIKIGEHIMQNGIDMQDPFSWHEDLPYTYPHWLYDVGTYIVYNFSGMTGIYVATAILSCILGLVIYGTSCKITKNRLVSFVMAILALFGLRSFIAARAQLVTFILFVLEVYCIEMFLEKKKIRYGVGLILISILIANLHIAVWPFFFVIFMPYIAEYIIAKIQDFHIINKIHLKYLDNKIKKYEKKNKQIEKEKIENQKDIVMQKFEKFKQRQKEIKENPYKIKIEKKTWVKGLILIMIICAFTGLLTPLGDAPYTYLVKTMQGNTTENINEHQPIVFENNKYALVAVGLFLVILIFTDMKIRLRDLFMISGLLLLMIKSQRQFSIFIIIGIFILGKLIAELFEKYDKEGTDQFIELMTTWIGKILTTLLIILISYLVAKDKFDDKIVDDSSYPVEAAEFIKNNLDVENIRLYNEYNYGSYLLFQDIPVFIDSRADLYTPEFNMQNKDIFSDFMNISSVNSYYENLFEKYNFTHIMMYKNARLNIFISRDENYKELYSDDNFIIYERNTDKVNGGAKDENQ